MTLSSWNNWSGKFPLT